MNLSDLRRESNQEWADWLKNSKCHGPIGRDGDSSSQQTDHLKVFREVRQPEVLSQPMTSATLPFPSDYGVFTLWRDKQTLF